MNREIHTAVEQLRTNWEAGDPSDPALRQACAVELGELRARYREQPDRFAPDLLQTLRRIADGLRASESPTALRPAATLERALETLRSTFGYRSFRPGQETVLEAVLSGRDCIAVMPTGAGKSLTYQLPARLLGGTTLVVSPLIALMKDQVDALDGVGLRATYLNSTLEPEERTRRVQALRSGAYELIYAAPEGLEASIGSALDGVRLSLIAVDEAHCISQWGHDFRPAYRNLAALKARFGGVPLLALTATATHEVVRDIVHQLAMVDPVELRGSCFRPNLQLHAYKKGGQDGSVRESILKLVRARPGQSGIVYCLSRKAVDGMAEHLRDHGIPARAYHAGMDANARAEAQEAFRRDEISVIVATIAFGMGIDKPDIRFVIHRDMPRSIEAYYQEIGRAGRDGEASDCVLFYSFADVMSYERFSEPTEPEIAERQRRQIRAMYDLAERSGCRHRALVAHFGERIEACRGSCDQCGSGDLLAEAAEVSRTQHKVERSTASRSGTSPRPKPIGDQVERFERLRALRRRIADEKGLPAYVVFSDATLVEMAAQRPATDEALLAITGVGPKKLALYGPEFLAALRE